MNALLHIATLFLLICSAVGSINVFVKPDEQRKLACSAMARKRLNLFEHCSHGAYISIDKSAEVATTSKANPCTPFHQDALIHTAPATNLPGMRTPRCFVPNAESNGRNHLDTDVTKIPNIIKHCSEHAALQCTLQPAPTCASPRRYYVITLRRLLC